jgi:hypothetical protein
MEVGFADDATRFDGEQASVVATLGGSESPNRHRPIGDTGRSRRRLDSWKDLDPTLVYCSGAG